MRKILIGTDGELWEAWKEEGLGFPILDPHRRKKDLIYSLKLELGRVIKCKRNKEDFVGKYIVEVTEEEYIKLR